MDFLFKDKYEYDYYRLLINPVLYDTWFSYFNNHNNYTSYNTLLQGSKYILKFLTENKNETFINFCYKILNDVYNFIICSIDDYDKYKNLIFDDFSFIFKELNKSNKLFRDTLYIIYYSIIHFVKFQQEIYKYTYYCLDYNFDYISDSDDEELNLLSYYEDNDLFI